MGDYIQVYIDVTSLVFSVQNQESCDVEFLAQKKYECKKTNRLLQYLKSLKSVC